MFVFQINLIDKLDDYRMLQSRILFFRRIIIPTSKNTITFTTNFSRNMLPLLATNKGYSTEALPPLPVPELEKTMEKFLSLAEAIQSKSEYQQTLKIAKSFQDSGEGRDLQKFLQKRAANLPNWLTPWWLEMAYLSARTPLPVVTSPGVTFPYFGFSGMDLQIEYAARIIQSALKFHHKVLRNELEPDKSHGKPLDMGQYKLLFGTTRIPRTKKDVIRYGKDEPKWANHILVTRNGNTFCVQVYDEQGNQLGLDHLQTQLRQICLITDKQPPEIDAVNIVSSDGRESWAALYERLKSKNPAEIEIVENALFTLALDRDFGGDENMRPEDVNMAMALHGGGAEKNSRNRWFDKTLQFYVNENGYGGMTYEHTPAEGPPLARLLDFICDEIERNQFETKSFDGIFIKPIKLTFKLDETDKAALRRAEANLERVVQNLEVRSLAFNQFGKNVPKRMQLSPDSWIQLALQIAYFRIHRSHAPAYETGTLRRFHEGRTDTIRLPNKESVHFVEAISQQPRPATTTPSVLSTLLESAIASHKQYAVDVMNGHGIDRHLLGLKLIAAENGRPIPALFQTDAYKKLMHFLLSTSQVPTKNVLPMGFGPSDPDCYGICYNPQESRIFFTITADNECRETSAKRFAEELSRALCDMRDVVDMAGRIKERAKL